MRLFEPCQCVRQPYTTGIPERDGVFDTFFIYQISSLGQPGVFVNFSGSIEFSEMVLQCVNITQKVVKGENISSLEL